MEVETGCPYCGEAISLFIDEGGGPEQSYVEDCAVCCRPFTVNAAVVDGEASVQLSRLDG